MITNEELIELHRRVNRLGYHLGLDQTGYQGTEAFSDLISRLDDYIEAATRKEI